MADRGEGRLDDVGGSKMRPVRGGEIVEHEQLVEGALGLRPGLGLPDLVQPLPGLRLAGLGEGVQHVPGLVHPAVRIPVQSGHRFRWETGHLGPECAGRPRRRCWNGCGKSARWTLRSGAAQGADPAFEEGAEREGGAKEISLPKEGFRQRTTREEGGRSASHPRGLREARAHHPAWKPAQRRRPAVHDPQQLPGPGRRRRANAGGRSHRGHPGGNGQRGDGAGAQAGAHEREPGRRARRREMAQRPGQGRAGHPRCAMDRACPHEAALAEPEPLGRRREGD